MIRKNSSQTAFLFPGQGAQYVGMGKEFYQNFSVVRDLWQEAEEILRASFIRLILEGPEATLTETRNSQIAIYLTSLAIFTVIQQEYGIVPSICAGLSLGEYTALTAAQKMNFTDTLLLVKKRAEYMNEACETFPGTMIVVIGLDIKQVQELVKQAALPQDIWIANINCPGQVVLSGTKTGMAKVSDLAKSYGAKRVIALQVHGAFHSGLMKIASEKLAPSILEAAISEGIAEIVMNVPGDFVTEQANIKHYLVQQVSHSVLWEKSIHSIAQEDKNIKRFIEVGPGKTLKGMNMKIGVQIPTISIETLEDLKNLESV